MSDKPRKPKPDEKKKPAEKPISLKPLKFEEAVSGLLKVKPVKNIKEEAKKAGS